MAKIWNNATIELAGSEYFGITEAVKAAISGRRERHIKEDVTLKCRSHYAKAMRRDRQHERMIEKRRIRRQNRIAGYDVNWDLDAIKEHVVNLAIAGLEFPNWAKAALIDLDIYDEEVYAEIWIEDELSDESREVYVFINDQELVDLGFVF